MAPDGYQGAMDHPTPGDPARRAFLLRAGALSLGVLPFLARGAEPADSPAKARPDPYAGAVFVDGEPPLPEEGSFTFAVLPDTQYYSEKYPATYLAQTRWLVAQRERRRIEAVFHLGDITNQNTAPQWTNARQAMQVLMDAGLPMCLVPGNHDYGPRGNGADRTSLMSTFFPVTDLAAAKHWGGNYDKEPDRVENSWHRLEVGGRRFLVLCLEFGPRNDVVRWANGIVAAHPDREVILLTHVLIYHDETRYDWGRYGTRQDWNPHAYTMAKRGGDDVNDGEELWTKLISRHENFRLTLNGHVLGDGLGRVVTSTAKGRAVPQVLVNFQMKPNGGDGWLRLIEMRKDGTMRTFDYSPTRRQTNASPQNQFTIPWA
jgi:predicted phosphodiesterase